MADLHTWLIIIIIIIVTALLRFLPFVVFNHKVKTPKFIDKLGKVLPYAIMGMLVVYCLKDTTLESINSFLPTIICCFVVALIYIWKRNTLISIVLGTICYMLLIQFIF